MPHKITEYLNVDVTETKATLIVAIEKIYPSDKKNEEINKIIYSSRLKLKILYKFNIPKHIVTTKQVIKAICKL